MATAHTHPDTTDILSRTEAPPRPTKGAEVLDGWRASLGGLFRSAGDFEPEARARA